MLVLMDMTSTGWESYQQAGFAGLCAFLLLVLFGALIWALKNKDKQLESVTGKAITAVEQSTAASKRVGDVLEELKKSHEEGAQRTTEFLAYLKARDEFGGRRRG